MQYAIILPMLDTIFPSAPPEPAADLASDNDAVASPSVLRAERQLRMLEELAQIGMDLARALGRRAEADGVDAASDAGCKPALAARDPADAFQRLSRAIRLTLALEMKTDETLRALQAGEATAEASRREAAIRRAEAAKARSRQVAEHEVRAVVAQAIVAEIEGDEALDDCYDALDERLEDDESYEDLADKPLRQTVERLCADLGLSPDWSAWSDDDGWAEPGKFGRPAHSLFNQPSQGPYGCGPSAPREYGARLE
ncbi:MAG: hypothetical protein ABI306_04400 [Caulobacteraceae bacterium]